jgi:hypothetical protein
LLSADWLAVRKPATASIRYFAGFWPIPEMRLLISSRGSIFKVAKASPFYEKSP